jgi:PleD family two-component response regulator
MMEKDLDGYVMLNDFRKDASLKDVPIIMYSGMAEQIGVNFRSAVEDEKVFPKVSFVDKRDGTKELIPEVNKILKA